MIVNKRLVEDDENVLARKVFVTLVKLYPRGYSILNDGNFVKKIYAASDDEAIRQFNELATKGKLLTESVKKAVKEQIVEAKHETLVESVMSDLDLEVKEAGGKEAWIANVDEQIDDLSHYLNYLKKSAYNEVNRGGNFESTDEVDEAIRNCEKQLGLLKSKKQIIEERKDESVNEALYGMNQVEQFVKMADAIGLKTMDDFKDFMDREGQGKDVITALYDYLHDEIGDLDFQAKDESLKETYEKRCKKSPVMEDLDFTDEAEIRKQLAKYSGQYLTITFKGSEDWRHISDLLDDAINSDEEEDEESALDELESSYRKEYDLLKSLEVEEISDIADYTSYVVVTIKVDKDNLIHNFSDNYSDLINMPSIDKGTIKILELDKPTVQSINTSSMTRDEMVDFIADYVWDLSDSEYEKFKDKAALNLGIIWDNLKEDPEEGVYPSFTDNGLKIIIDKIIKAKSVAESYNRFKGPVYKKDNSLKEDLAVAVNGEEVPIDATNTPVVEPVVVEVDAEKQPIEEIQEKISIEQVLSDLIKDEFEAIDGYSSSLATLKILENDGSDYSGIIANLEDIKNEELVHVGQLQKCLAEVNPKAEAIDDGKEEASETIAVAEEESAKGEEHVVEA